MARKTTHLSARLPKRSEPKSSPDGKRAEGNKILRDLLADERNLVSSTLEPVALVECARHAARAWSPDRVRLFPPERHRLDS